MGKSGGQAIKSIFGGGKAKLGAVTPPSAPVGGKLVLHPTSIAKVAGDMIANGLKSGKLKQLGPNDWETVGGLRFKGIDGAGNNRVAHVAEHLTVTTKKKTGHSIFTISTDKLLDTLDEAWKKKGPTGWKKDKSPDSGAYNIDLGKTIGADGETVIRIIVNRGTNEVIGAYPYKPQFGEPVAKGF